MFYLFPNQDNWIEVVNSAPALLQFSLYYTVVCKTFKRSRLHFFTMHKTSSAAAAAFIHHIPIFLLSPSLHLQTLQQQWHQLWNLKASSSSSSLLHLVHFDDVVALVDGRQAQMKIEVAEMELTKQRRRMLTRNSIFNPWPRRWVARMWALAWHTAAAVEIVNEKFISHLRWDVCGRLSLSFSAPHHVHHK